MKPKLTWLLVPISLGAFLATWGGWAKLATMTGFREVEMIPGQTWSVFNIGAVLPMTVEPFGALAMAVAFNSKVRPWARVVAGIMAFGALAAAGLCQIVVHQLTVQNKEVAPDLVVSVASVLPVVVLGLGGALAMLNAARVPAGTVETSQGPSLGDALGRIAFASLGRVEARLNRPVEAPAGTSQPTVPSRDIVPVPTTMVVPEVPEAAVPVSVPAAQAVYPDRPQGWDGMSRDDQARAVLKLREERPRPSYQTIADRLGVSKSEAGRLGQHAQDILLKLDGDPVILPVNGYEHPAMNGAGQ